MRKFFSRLISWALVLALVLGIPIQGDWQAINRGIEALWNDKVS